MRLALMTTCVLVLTVGAYASRVSLRQQFHHASAQAALPQPQAQTGRDRQGTLGPDARRENTSVTAESSVARRRAEPHRSSGGPASDAQLPQPGNRQSSEAMAFLLGLALLNNSGPARADPGSR
jgi:hypothetical protein